MENNLVRTLIELIKNTRDFNKKVEYAELLGFILWHNNLGVYELDIIEQHLIDNLPFEILSNKLSIDVDRFNDCLFIVSEPYVTGGHTRLMERLSQFVCDKSNVDLLISRSVSEQALLRMNLIFRYVMQANGCDKTDLIYEMALIIARYNRVILNMHPDDIAVTLACSVAKKLSPSVEIYFVNHSDHTFTYGKAIADIWFQISLYGLYVDKLRNLNCRTSFLGIPIPLVSSEVANKHNGNSFDNGDLIVTAASQNKYKPHGGENIFHLLKSLLEKYDKSDLLVIGVNPFTNYWWWNIKLRFPSRIKFFNSIPYEQYLLLTRNAKLYIDSHPIPGGTAFIEQFISGKICAGLIGSFQGYSPLDKVKKHTSYSALNSLDHTPSEALINEIIDVHSYDAVKKRFVDVLFNNVISPNSLVNYNQWSGNVNFLKTNRINQLPCSSLLLSGCLLRSAFNSISTYGCFKFAAKLVRLVVKKYIVDPFFNYKNR